MAVRYLLVTAEDSWLVGFYDEGIQDGDEGVVAWTGIDPEKDGSVGELGEWVVGLFARLNLRMRASEDPATVA
jgi:hypothetical protein